MKQVTLIKQQDSLQLVKPQLEANFRKGRMAIKVEDRQVVNNVCG
ncbi:hypothetical protein [uncultured Gammaproteobacteria bacterium]|nr:hypothetical protein [uncultured Gammaproteobacteria bacterium]CAC9607552.1 hypothetical protein [uncultured Gammaproteobacteria bacterium]